jgi:two-component system, OmpR family, response regulator MprA
MSLVDFRRDWANFWRSVRELWEEAGQPEYRAALIAPSVIARTPNGAAPVTAFAPEEGANGTTLRFNDLALDTRTRDVCRRERSMELTPTEFRLLELLLRNPRQVLTREVIFDRVWGFDFGPNSNTLSVYIGYLRRKTEADGEPRLIHTVRGVGYMLRD